MLKKFLTRNLDDLDGSDDIDSWDYRIANTITHTDQSVFAYLGEFIFSKKDDGAFEIKKFSKQSPKMEELLFAFLGLLEREDGEQKLTQKYRESSWKLLFLAYDESRSTCTEIVIHINQSKQKNIRSIQIFHDSKDENAVKKSEAMKEIVSKIFCNKEKYLVENLPAPAHAATVALQLNQNKTQDHIQAAFDAAKKSNNSILSSYEDNPEIVIKETNWKLITKKQNSDAQITLKGAINQEKSCDILACQSSDHAMTQEEKFKIIAEFLLQSRLLQQEALIVAGTKSDEITLLPKENQIILSSDLNDLETEDQIMIRAFHAAGFSTVFFGDMIFANQSNISDQAIIKVATQETELCKNKSNFFHAAKKAPSILQKKPTLQLTH